MQFSLLGEYLRLLNGLEEKTTTTESGKYERFYVRT